MCCPKMFKTTRITCVYKTIFTLLGTIFTCKNKNKIKSSDVKTLGTQF